MDRNDDFRRARAYSDSGLKPLMMADTASVSSGYSVTTEYKPVRSEKREPVDYERVEAKDLRLKQRIRKMKFVSRLLTVIIDAITIVPLIMTVVKYLQTRMNRYTWPNNAQAWYTYETLGVSGVSLILDTIVLFMYCQGVRTANRASSVAGKWASVAVVIHLAVWTASLTVYKYGSLPKNGQNNDLWGYSCSSTADSIQPSVKNVNFSLLCEIQVSRTASFSSRTK